MLKRKTKTGQSASCSSSTMSPLTKPQSVCVLGAGPAGLCALRHFCSRSEHFSPIVCYEQTDQIGGTWNYSEHTSLNFNGLPVYSSVYRNLRTNIPLQGMAFPDFAYTGDLSYVHHSQVLQYLQQYVQHYSISRYINFGHKIQRLSRDLTNECWQVTVENLLNKQQFTKNFDIVVLCPGKNCSPKWPKIDSIRTFSGSMIHSHEYRFPEPYSGQRVGIIGGGPSGVDIACEVSAVASEVFFINRKERQFTNLPSNIRQIKGSAVQFTANSMVIEVVGEEPMHIQVDSIILATGFNLCLKFIDAVSAGIKVNDDGTIEGIFRHLINIKYPSMAVMSFLKNGLSFGVFNQQILYYIKTLLGEAQPLPCPALMYREVKADFAKRKALGFSEKDRHRFTIELITEYFELLQIEGKYKPFPPVILKLHAEIIRAREKLGWRAFRQVKYRILDENNFEIVE